MCPICDKNLKYNHQCPQSVLNAIDSANTRAWEPWPEFWRGYHERLAEGFAMLAWNV